MAVKADKTTENSPRTSCYGSRSKKLIAPKKVSFAGNNTLIKDKLMIRREFM